MPEELQSITWQKKQKRAEKKNKINETYYILNKTNYLAWWCQIKLQWTVLLIDPALSTKKNLK
jgi:hypothetical protein